MRRARIPTLLRAVALFLASLPMARAAAASGIATHPMPATPAHEAHLPRPAAGAAAAGTAGLFAVAALGALRSPDRATQAQPGTRELARQDVSGPRRSADARPVFELVRREAPALPQRAAFDPGTSVALAFHPAARALPALRPRAP